MSVTSLLLNDFDSLIGVIKGSLSLNDLRSDTGELSLSVSESNLGGLDLNSDYVSSLLV